MFPLEITDMHHSHQVLRGPDPVVGLVVAPADLRAAVEHELRGKLLRLRQGYAARSSDESALGAITTRSASSLLALLRGLLTLQGRPVPTDALQTASAASAMMGIDDESLLGVVRHRGETSWRCTPAAYEAYLDAVARAAGYVDQLNIGDQR